ncbi:MULTISPECIES: MarR family winged helix-turn-helix transcriptional regulator [Leucobacter]|uniref:MarR family winged helix-turn-helix transcriptional regulator n=1 Tax=Leucobacter TaxID=55968 RepID=UPI000E65D5F7|nr:MarR family winged helix-turn-helix transcriptional regulator [Leucobacter aridicollis]UTX52986.1 winged helix-turn-helix transcriptional regulator [Leucobacter aridicollis]
MSSISPEEETVAGIITEFTEAFAFSRTRWTRYANEVSAELSGVSMLVLQIVFRRGPITATGVSHWLDMDKSLVSRHVAKLRDLDLVIATESPEDRRVQLLTVSDHATELLSGVRERWTNAYRERLVDWSQEELEALRAGLHRFNASADKLPADGPDARCSKHSGEGDSAA